MNRYLVLFAREPGREAREKGFGARGRDLFATFAMGWLAAARQVGARLVLATPGEDRAGWRASLPAGADVLWIEQRGAAFGQRLEAVARQAAELPGRAVLVGGDAAPRPHALREAFEAIENGQDAALAPATDGGVSLIALRCEDADLLAALAPGQKGVVASLCRRLRVRGRCVELVSSVPDVDSRRGLRALLGALTGVVRAIARWVLRLADLPERLGPCASALRSLPASGLRAPPSLL